MKTNDKFRKFKEKRNFSPMSLFNRPLTGGKLFKVLFLSLVMIMFLTSCKNQTDKKTIGILQFANHPSLDNCRQGLIEGLAEAGYKEGENLQIDYQNAQADMGMVNQMAQAFVAKKYDLIVTIATPATMGAYNACMGTDIPIIYTAVTDPVAAKLAGPDGKSEGNISGTSDALPVQGQLEMIREIMPNAKRIGILYSSGEENSLSMIKQYEKYVKEKNFELKIIEITSSADIPMAADALLKDVDLVTNLLDNTVVSSLPTILEKADKKGIPVFGSEIEQVKIGCLGACGVEYLGLGRQTGKMAAKVLDGTKAGDLPFESLEEKNLYFNLEAAKKLNIEIPKSLLDSAKEVFEKTADPAGKN